MGFLIDPIVALFLFLIAPLVTGTAAEISRQVIEGIEMGLRDLFAALFGGGLPWA